MIYFLATWSRERFGDAAPLFWSVVIVLALSSCCFAGPPSSSFGYPSTLPAVITYEDWAGASHVYGRGGWKKSDFAGEGETLKCRCYAYDPEALTAATYRFAFAADFYLLGEGDTETVTPTFTRSYVVQVGRNGFVYSAASDFGGPVPPLTPAMVAAAAAWGDVGYPYSSNPLYETGDPDAWRYQWTYYNDAYWKARQWRSKAEYLSVVAFLAEGMTEKKDWRGIIPRTADQDFDPGSGGSSGTGGNVTVDFGSPGSSGSIDYETDSDEDGTPDYVDPYPNDSSKGGTETEGFTYNMLKSYLPSFSLGFTSLNNRYYTGTIQTFYGSLVLTNNPASLGPFSSFVETSRVTIRALALVFVTFRVVCSIVLVLRQW